MANPKLAVVIKAMTKGVGLDFIKEIVPIPDCSFLMDVTGLGTPIEVANEMVREARVWQENNPGKDVMDVITPEWKEYINHKIKHLC